MLQGNVKLNTMFNRREFVVQNIINNPDPQKEIDNLQKELEKAKKDIAIEGFDSADKVKESDEKLEKISQINKKLAEEIEDIDNLDDL